MGKPRCGLGISVDSEATRANPHLLARKPRHRPCGHPLPYMAFDAAHVCEVLTTKVNQELHVFPHLGEGEGVTKHCSDPTLDFLQAQWAEQKSSRLRTLCSCLTWCSKFSPRRSNLERCKPQMKQTLLISRSFSSRFRRMSANVSIIMPNTTVVTEARQPENPKMCCREDAEVPSITCTCCKGRGGVQGSAARADVPPFTSTTRTREKNDRSNTRRPKNRSSSFSNEGKESASPIPPPARIPLFKVKKKQPYRVSQ
jgi:hypothetical protein